ncbi:hypothetical protein B0H14DRAFT_3507181 [Mycena olivaceomarginata]|nr:hypothetical protein B0H14DRAFT_3507181 [Mycena olivaceomarginata]
MALTERMRGQGNSVYLDEEYSSGYHDITIRAVLPTLVSMLEIWPLRVNAADLDFDLERQGYNTAGGSARTAPRILCICSVAICEPAAICVFIVECIDVECFEYGGWYRLNEREVHFWPRQRACGTGVIDELVSTMGKQAGDDGVNG